jgi:hypothetical protein
VVKKAVMAKKLTAFFVLFGKMIFPLASFLQEELKSLFSSAQTVLSPVGGRHLFVELILPAPA